MGHKIKEMRKKKGYTQTELAHKSGVSRATICALENNTSKSVTTAILTKLADALDVSIDMIFFDDNVQLTVQPKENE